MTYIAKHTKTKAQAELVDMLSIRRPGQTKTERLYIEQYIDTLPGVMSDDYGNRYVEVGGANAPPILWTAHTDSVHKHEGVQSVQIKDGILRLHKDEKISNCLGADDGTGMWLMRQMILRGVPGYYAFFRDEESGAPGSTYAVDNHADWLGQMQFAIALDRKGYSSVITHQGSRTASDEFALSIAKQLGGTFAPDNTGVFTDTANLTSIVGECSNLSVGYGKQHTSGEAQNIPFALELLEKLCVLDPSKLVASRKPGEKDDDDWFGYKSYKADKYLRSWSSYYDDDYDYAGSDDREAILDVIYEHPEAVAELLAADGWTAKELARSIGKGL